MCRGVRVKGVELVAAQFAFARVRLNVVELAYTFTPLTPLHRCG
jgi:hypothetical protein